MDTPLIGELSMGAGISISGRPADAEDAPQVYHNIVGPRFFETMGIPVLSGRDFSIADEERAPRCVIISDSVARRYFSGENPLGRQVAFRGVVASVIGVVKDVRYTSLRTDAPLMIYRPARQEVGAPANTFLIRTSSRTHDALMSLVRAEVRAAAPTLPPASAVTLADQVAGSLVEERMLATLSGAIGVLAAILAAIGIYGVIAATVARRRREIGIRMAIGALPGRVARAIVADAFRIVAAGLVMGVPVTIATTLAARGLLADVLFGLSPGDPAVLLAATGAILLMASLAAWLPAHRASRIDPVAALKYE
jgi:putative ABC transport system permease protein